MIEHNDQLTLFNLIAKNLTKDIECYVFGGTAMMFYGYKDETKDIDLLFLDEKSRTDFINIITKLGFKQHSPLRIYIPEKLKEKHTPLMFERQDIRFDLFVKQIFRTKLSPNMKENVDAINVFGIDKEFIIKTLKKEHIVQLKAITERQNDFVDIRNIIEKTKDFDWQYLIDEIIWQDQHGDTWAILDTERVIKELQEYVFIEDKYLKQLYQTKK